MKKQLNQRGFTLAELLMAIAILTILMGIGFVAVNAYMKRLKQNELNWTAKEIFISAQNQLSKANASGVLSGITGGNKGISYVVVDAVDAEGNITKQHTEYYAIVNGDVWSSAKLEDVLLPFGSIDETVRAGGRYVIRYDYDSATVTQVYYAEDKEFSFADSDLNNEKFTKGELSDEERRDYRGSIIGFYDGASEDLNYENVKAPTKFEVVNDERLFANLGIENKDWRYILCIKGQSSGAQATMEPESTEIAEAVFLLDDITSKNKHFAMQFAKFWPGEDIELYVTVQHKTAFSNIEESNHIITNSLFASKITSDNSSTVRIGAFRHLENINRGISAVDLTDDKKINVVKAEQIKDLNWADFFKPSNLLASNKITGTDGYTIAGLENNSYAPVNLDYELIYSGNNRNISNLEVKASLLNPISSAGLFGTVSSKLTINDLELRNVNTSQGIGTANNAGALIGYGDNNSVLTIDNVIAYNTEEDKSKENKLEIKAKNNAGGLVGSATSADLTGCASSVYVKSEGNAGGLVGMLGSGTVKDSYFGAHTKDGEFLAPNASAESEGRINIFASQNAGGLIGTGTATISNCYSAGSIHGNNINVPDDEKVFPSSNYLIGSDPDANVTNSYNAGWIFMSVDNKWKPVYPDLDMDDFAGGNKYQNISMKHPAQTYDVFWSTENDYYPFLTINDLYSVYKDTLIKSDAWFHVQHVGDWALPGNRADFINTNN